MRAYLHDSASFGSLRAATLGRAPALDELDVIMCRSYLASLHGTQRRRDDRSQALLAARVLPSGGAPSPLPSSPVAALRAPKRAKRLPSFLGKEDVGRLLDGGARRRRRSRRLRARPRAGAVRGHLRRRAARLGGVQPRRRRRRAPSGSAPSSACGRAKGARIASCRSGRRRGRPLDAYLPAARRWPDGAPACATAQRAVLERARAAARARAPCAGCWRAARSPPARRRSHRTRCATATRRTCWARAPICAPSRSCSATQPAHHAALRARRLRSPDGASTTSPPARQRIGS